MASRRIMVVGCAKSGTTLLQRLFFMYRGVYLVLGEIGLKFLARMPSHRPFIVGKRSYRTVFSCDMPDDEINEQLIYAKDRGIEFVYIERERDSVLKSSNGYVRTERYDACVDQAKRFKSHLSYRLRFEDLVKDPDGIQRELSDHFGLVIDHPFSEYPKHIPEQFFHDFLDVRYRARKIGEPA